MHRFEPVTAANLPALTALLITADLTLSGLDASTVKLWLVRDERGEIVGSTGFEASESGEHVLIRSVAVDPSARGRGSGTAIARYAIDAAAAAGARRAWLFSRRSGPFWQKLGFEPADRDELACALAETHQVTLFRSTGQLEREVAWSRPL